MKPKNLKDLKNSDEKNELQSRFLKWVTKARSEHENFTAEWDTADQYFEQEQVPAGFSDEHAQFLADSNDPTVGNQDTKQYVVVNKVRETHESILGDFINGKKVVTVSAESPEFTRIATVARRELEYVEESNNVWDEVSVQAIDCAIRRGLHWIKVWHNPFKNVAKGGKIEVQEVSCRDILIDPNRRKPFFQDTKYRIHRMRFSLEQANKRFGQYIESGEFSEDNEYEEPYKDTVNKQGKFVTIYEIHYVEDEEHFFFYNQATDHSEEIDEDEFNEFMKSEDTAKHVFKQVEEKHYIALYNTKEGPFVQEENEFGMWLLIPVINIPSENRTYPLGDTLYYRTLQDLFNVLISVFLENAKNGNRPMVRIDPASYDRYSGIILEALDNPGRKVIPAEQFDVKYPQPVNQALVGLLQMTEKFIYDMQARHDATRGQVKSRHIARATMDMLLAQDRQSHGRKDVMIHWALTQMAKVIWRIIVLKYRHNHWLPVRLENGKDTFYPVNFTGSIQQYDQLILQTMGVTQLPEDPQQQAQLMQQMAIVKTQFEKENSVIYDNAPVWVIGDTIVPPDQLQEVFAASGLDEKGFMEKFQPRQETMPYVMVNMLAIDPDLQIKVDVDFDFERDKQMRQNRALILQARQIITPLRTLRDLDYPDPEDANKEAEEHNQLLQWGKLIVEHPEIKQALEILLQKLQSGEANAEPKKDTGVQ